MGDISGARGGFPPKGQGGVCWGLREPVSPPPPPPGAGEALGAEAVSLLTGGAVEAPKAVSKQLRNFSHNPHSDASPTSSQSCGRCMKSSLKF